MSKVICEREDLVNIADAVRSKTGSTGAMTLGEIANGIGGISGEQETPVISVSSGGLITATAGDKTSTHQLSTQATKIVTPSTSSQTAVASGKYTTGAVTVAAIPSTYVQPTGTLSVTANGTHDVKNYASVDVNVAGSGGGSTGAVETCSVTLSCPTGCNLVYNYVKDGEVSCGALCYPFAIDSTTFNNAGGSSIVKGSYLICGKSNTNGSSGVTVATTGNVEVIRQNTTYTSGAVFKINGDCTITIT